MAAMMKLAGKVDDWEDGQPPPKQKKEKKVSRRKSSLFDQMTTTRPTLSTGWWCFKHPLTRIATSIFVLVCNIYIYVGDPGTYSNARSYGTFIGDVYHGFLQPDDPQWIIARLLLLLFLLILGFFFGMWLQQKVLRDYFHLVLFGYDNHRDHNRDPLAYQEGAFFCVICAVCVSWFVGLKVYALILTMAGAKPKHIPDSGMYGWTFAGYNLVLAGYMTFISDWWMVGAVVDQMLQAIGNQEGEGYDAYARSMDESLDEITEENAEDAAPAADVDVDADDDGSLVSKNPKAIKKRAKRKRGSRLRACIDGVGQWWLKHRILVTRVYLLIGWPTGCVAMHLYYKHIMDVLNPHTERKAFVALGKQWAWTAEWNDEYMRMLGGALVATGNLAICAQDWDFPNFDGADGIKIMGLKFSFFYIHMPNWVQKFLQPHVTYLASIGPRIFPAKLDPKFYVSGKWFSYFGILFGLVFDWAYWFSTALCFRPCDYAHLWDSSTGVMYAITDHHLQEHYAGAATAKECHWFTDNPLQDLYFNRSMTQSQLNETYGVMRQRHAAELHAGEIRRFEEEKPFVVKLEVASFKGAYTIDEFNNYVFTENGAGYMWLMCIPPVLGWIGIAFIVFTYEKVTCFNAHRVLAWSERQAELDDEDFDEDDVDNIGGGGKGDYNIDGAVEGGDEDDDDAESMEKRRRKVSVDNFQKEEEDEVLAKARKYKRPTKTALFKPIGAPPDEPHESAGEAL
mmetsp:Transcript_44814/g.90531  ORF Transcript_44814/g.90531 Transcript_44814/m.90531 type:complete len:736 (-) Transcript_44814:264-2471(-)|eukprot:CAMPEP_0171704008 /NCGR_PEP_ID=MMETSP0991-20121206/12437_1 /TAXON_ID=483369 /ORGANISM="non described non described, Strain CCMP2098" /LENGTH=735 /DNA_ID=CAMNT_0012293463 /DNA_START=30 /DNA_END=2237 /DNA_ORIENTATION=+